MKQLCIYHANCADGFGAAWAVRHALGDIDFFPATYGDEPPDVAGRDVVIVDFSYKWEVLEEMAKTAKSIQIFDHHKTAAEDLKGLPLPGVNYPPISPIAKVTAVFDMERSGAGIAWDCFNPGKPRPKLINHIEDRDLWRFALPCTREIQAMVFSYPYDFAVWDHLVHVCESYPSWLIDQGRAIERQHHKDVAELVRVCRREMVIGGLRLPVANLPYTLTSDAGHSMASDHPARAAACYWDTADGRVFSLRSTDDGPDVSEIAARYGGGGHAHAAGFRAAIGWEGE